MYGETTLHCAVNITRGVRECVNDVVLFYTCALLNSGGGILHMHNLDAQRGPVVSKDLDTWWSAVECKMADMISRDDICNYFDLVGNYDDPDLYLFVKTAEHLCTLEYHSRLPTDTATHEVTYQSVLKLLTQKGEMNTLNELPQVPSVYNYGCTAEELKKETKQIQFKQLSSPKSKGSKSLPEKICFMMSKYISAFANHEGGHIYFGIDDVRAAVIGEELSEVDREKTERLAENKMRTVIWGEEEFVAERGRHWDIRFFPVLEDHNLMKQDRVVVVLSICKFPGGVFTSCPESYYVSPYKSVSSFTFTQWKMAMLSSQSDVPGLHSRFVKVPMQLPNPPLIFTLPHTVNTIKEKLLAGNLQTCNPQPRHVLEKLVPSNSKELIKETLQVCKGGKCVIFATECWGLKIPHSRPDEVLCDVLIISEDQDNHLVTFATCQKPHVLKHSQEVAVELKRKLVLQGGCSEKFGIICHVADINRLCTNPQDFSAWKNSILSSVLYPSHFRINSSKFDKILDAVVVTMASYPASDLVSDENNTMQCENFQFLLTCDQFELLWTQQFTKELWVHGPPGSGKTVAAIQLIQELRRRGCRPEEIVYLAENHRLCSLVRHHNICLVAERRKLMDESKQEEIFLSRYGQVCNVVVDEVQNFKDRDGDWYSLAGKLATQNAGSVLKTGYFWLFMDYSQKVHKFNAGLPAVIGKNNFMLSEVTRHSIEIFDFASHFMRPRRDSLHAVEESALTKVDSIPKLGHDYRSGKGVDILSCNEAEIRSTIGKILQALLQNGLHENDIAILVGKRKDLERVQSAVNEIDLSSDQEFEQFEHRSSNVSGLRPCFSMGTSNSNLSLSEKKQQETNEIRECPRGNNSVSVDTVKSFSGLDKAAIIGINPEVNEENADFNKFILSLASRARDNLVIVTTSDEVKNKIVRQATTNLTD
ncbi:hypothetical protein CHS0354_003326 [Potamilus streckersoni]|nr:hypothetical protein CHS0354_003326 [Potamilus streckersoni]